MYDLTIPDWTAYMPAGASPSRKICSPRLTTRLGNDEGPGETTSAANQGVIRQRVRAGQSRQSGDSARSSAAGRSAASSWNTGRARPDWNRVSVPLGVVDNGLPLAGIGMVSVLVEG
jgi:hypothetical protein